MTAAAITAAKSKPKKKTKVKPIHKPKVKTQSDKMLVTFLLDRSGSMACIRTDTIGAFNVYLEGLQQEPENIEFSFLQFDSESIDTLFMCAPVGTVPKLDAATFVPRGGTPLIEAATKTITALDQALAKRTDQPRVVVCFQTDGEENQSAREYSWANLKTLIKARTKAGWEFKFMGAGIDAYDQAARMGVAQSHTVSYDAADRRSTMAVFAASASNDVNMFRGLQANTGYSVAQKQAAGDTFDPGVAVNVQVGVRPKRMVGAVLPHQPRLKVSL